MNRIYPSMIVPHTPFGTPMQPGTLTSREDLAGFDPSMLSAVLQRRTPAPIEQFAENAKSPAPSCAPGEVERLREAVKLTVADASHHLRKWRPHCLEALEAALSPQGLDATLARGPDYGPLAHGMRAKTEVDRLAILLFEAFAKAEPREGITLYPASYWATFADMARAIIADRDATPSERLDAAYGVPTNIVDQARAIIVRVVSDAAIRTTGDRKWLQGIADDVRNERATDMPSYLVMDCVIAALKRLDAATVEREGK